MFIVPQDFSNLFLFPPLILGFSVQSEKPKGTLKEQISIIKPVLEDLRRRREERVKEFSDVQSHILRICAEIAGNAQLSNTTDSQVDERDLTFKKLEELKSHLQELLKEKVCFQNFRGNFCFSLPTFYCRFYVLLFCRISVCRRSMAMSILYMSFQL